MNPKAPTNQRERVRFLKQGEGPTREFKRSKGELKEGMRTLCAFLNGSGGMGVFRVWQAGTIEGQGASYQTLRHNYLHHALQKGLIEMTVPDKPNSRLQKYRLTEKSKRRFQ